MMHPRGILGLKKNTRRRCLCCRQLFRCHPRWLGKPENQGYFSGPQHVSRVQAWREANPGYGGKIRRKAPALQETMISQPIEQSRESLILPLQDAIGLQVIADADPTGVRNGSALQDVM